MVDGILFDLDGTLWDAVDSYTELWNRTNAEFGLDARVTREDLLRYMGKPIDIIFSALMGDVKVDKQAYLQRLDYWESTLMPQLGGRLYPGVVEGLKRLSDHYKLFLVSNCGSDGLKNMMRFAGITPCITDTLTYGETERGKDFNIAEIVRRNKLSAPLYIGDTQGDSDAAHAAGAAMAWASWGFGSCADAELTFDSFNQLTDTLISLDHK